MLHARNASATVMAKDVTRADGPFTCLECGAPVVLKKGQVKIHHFAHVVSVGCEHSGESERHRQLKEELCTVLARHPDLSDLQ